MIKPKECVAFICVQNAGRSQMAAAFAKRKVNEKGLPIGIVSGGTDPADSVHEAVVEAMDEIGYDISGNKPRKVKPEELEACNYVITMGCSATGVCPATWEGTDREWDLDDPADSGLKKVRRIRNEIEKQVNSLLDGIMDKYPKNKKNS